MEEMAAWVRDVLLSRGALVEMQGAETLRALLPSHLAQAMGTAEWLSLDFGRGPGADHPADWLDKVGRLVEGAPGARPAVATARLASPAPFPPLDVAAVLERHLAIQNGIYRLLGESAALACYVVFTFQYAVESDERRIRFLTVALNASASSWVPQPDQFLAQVWERLEQGAQSSPSPAELAAVYPLAARAARSEIRKLVEGAESAANRRLARDVDRVEAYYRGLLGQIEKRVSRAPSAAALEKEHSRARATELDRLGKLEDLRRKYSLCVRIEPADVLAIRAPAREIRVRLVRRKEERERAFHWNLVLRRLEPALCENCSTAAHPLCLCDKVHCLCEACLAPCPHCGKISCPVCSGSCRCRPGPS
jgi:hypothetical protein